MSLERCGKEAPSSIGGQCESSPHEGNLHMRHAKPEEFHKLVPPPLNNEEVLISWED